MTRVLARRSTSETGASLLIALVMVTGIGVALVAALGFGTTSLRTVSAVDQQRNAAYAADSAVQTAIQALRSNASAGTGAAGAACPTVNYAATGAQPAVTVACQVVSSSPTGIGDTMPPYAILALGSSASETGLKLTASGTLTLAGPLASNSPAVAGTNSVSVGKLDLTGYTLDANGTCSGTYILTAAADKQCSTGLSTADPGYPSQPLTNILLTVNPAPTCTADGAVLQFSPGYYTNKAILIPASTVAGYTANGHACTVNYLYFQPGVYYFDFGFDPAFTGKVWAVAANQTVVGGEPNGWDPNVAGSLPPAPGGGSAAACKTEANGGTTGVQFVFGGVSQMTVIANTSSVELCADPTPIGTNQQIAIYGQQTGADPTPQINYRLPVAATPTPSSGWTGLTPTNNLLPISPSTAAIDTQVASYPVPAVLNGTTASVDYTGYAAIPAGSINVSYSLQVAHQEVATAAANISTLKFTITPASGPACTPTAPTKHWATTPGALTTDSIALSAACKTAVASDGYTITYAVKSASNKAFTEYLDGVDLVATYTPPAVRAESGCVIDTSVAGCDVLKAGTGSAKFYLWGTVYTPLASVTATFTATGAFEFRRGVVVRAIVNSGTPPADSTRSFCLGAGSPCLGPAHVLLLTATVNGSVRLRALVQIADSPALGSALQILSWNVIRG
jgi:hypothetical protein